MTIHIKYIRYWNGKRRGCIIMNFGSNPILNLKDFPNQSRILLIMNGYSLEERGVYFDI